MLLLESSRQSPITGCTTAGNGVIETVPYSLSMQKQAWILHYNYIIDYSYIAYVIGGGN